MDTEIKRQDWRANFPKNLISTELEGLYGTAVLADMWDTIQMYDIYENGAEYPIDTKQTDYVPANLRFRGLRAIIEKEARFLFSKSPDLWVEVNLGDDSASRERASAVSSVYQSLVDSVLEQNHFRSSILKAAKDCFISKRVALIFNVNEETGMQISFLPSLEFVYDVDPNDSSRLTKLVVFYGLNNVTSKAQQRIYKKKYWMENGSCWFLEEIYDGSGKLVETIQPSTKTLFSFIPAWVIVNDGLTGDLLGVSEVSQLKDYESWYSRLASADIDAERKGMNPIRWTRDMSPESTAGLSISAGAFWDLSTDQNTANGTVGEVGVLDSPMSYSSALSTTLDRIKQTMYEQCAVPNVSPDAMKGVVSSGKTLKAIYWDLIVRCEEKMLEWRPALEFMVRCIIEGARLYPRASSRYLSDPLPAEPYTVRVDNQYPLPEDETEEKQTDLAEVNNQTMSKKAYMKKWRNLTDDEADAELRQIALERQLLEDSFVQPPFEPSEEQQEEQPEEV